MQKSPIQGNGYYLHLREYKKKWHGIDCGDLEEGLTILVLLCNPQGAHTENLILKKDCIIEKDLSNVLKF